MILGDPDDPKFIRFEIQRCRGDQHVQRQSGQSHGQDQPGHDFILWKSASLAGGSWQKVTNAVVTESDGQMILTDPAPGTTRAFYLVDRDTGL